MTVLSQIGLLLGLLSSIRRSAADFTGVSFDRATENGSLNLTWDNSGLDASFFPLVVAVSLINQTESGVFGFKSDLSDAKQQSTTTLCTASELTDDVAQLR
jgi:hypothetical protein